VLNPATLKKYILPGWKIRRGTIHIGRASANA
jgi:hypothetical protein